MDTDAALVARIVDGCGLPAGPVSELVGLGSVNRVFVVGSPGSRFVVRIAIDPLRAEEFTTEDWCLRRAAAAGILSPEPLAHGVLDGAAFGVQRYVEHLPHERTDRRAVWRELGRYARCVNQLTVTDDAPSGLFSRFGRDLPTAWRAHLEYSLGELNRADPLVTLGVYGPAERRRLRQAISSLGETELSFGLSHGDLAPRNALRRADGSLVLIDWGSASCGPVPYTDLLVLQRPDDLAGPNAGDLAAFAAGYGIELGDLDETLAAIRVLSALDLVRWALERRPDRLTELGAAAREVLARPPGG